MNTKDAIRILADEAQNQGADAEDSNGVVEAIVRAHGLGFNAWFCVLCEIADRNAQAEGYDNQGHRAASLMRKD